MIPLLKPSTTRREVDAVTEVLWSGWWGQGPKCDEFERKLADRHGYRYAVAVNSATAALHLACKVAGVGPGSMVVTTPLTFVSSALAPLYESGPDSVVFADVDEDSLCLDWAAVMGEIGANGGKVAAIIPVDYAGYPSKPPDSYLEALHELDIPVIQDAAHHVGGIMYGDLVCMSFHPVKNLATGDGGAILTNNPEWYERLKALRWCGINKSTHERAVKSYGWDYDIAETGYKYNWNDIQAAIGLVQLDRLDDMIQRRIDIAHEYYRRLEGVPNVQPPEYHPGHTWHLYPIRVPAEHRDGLIDALLARGVSAGVHYKPLYHYPMFADLDRPEVVDREWQRLVSLPIFYDLTMGQVDYICRVIREVAETWR